jgi:lysophospholipase L1-like esterase
VRLLFILTALAVVGSAQPADALLDAKQINQFCVRAGQLMDAGGVVIPDLQRAAAPEVEKVKQACVQLQSQARAGQATYTLLNNIRIYLSLADSVPRPVPFPETARKQIEELRDGAAQLDSHFRALLDLKDAQLRTSDRDNLARYDDANRKTPPPNPSKPRVVFLGDSITDSWRLNEYFPDRDFINRGISGQITGEMLGRMKADVIDLHPEAVVILAGTNDLARNIPLTVIENNYLMLADLATYNHIKVIFASVLPVTDAHKDVNPQFEQTKNRPPVFIDELNAWIQRLCSQRGYTYLNYYAAMVDSAGRLKDDLTDDGLHPNPMGYRVMAPVLLDAVQKTLKPKPAAPAPITSNKKRESGSAK